MPLLSPKSLAGPGYVILNILRGLNIIGLLAIIAASLVMLVKTKVVTSFFFFDAVGHVVVLIICGFLIISEASLFRNYFLKNWPLLSPSHGFILFGLTMFVLGISTLGNLNTEDHSQDSLGLAFWRIVISAGVLAFILGVFNIAATFIFRDSENGITARQVRAKGAVAVSESGSIRYNISYPTKADSFHTVNTASAPQMPFNSPPKAEAVAEPAKKHRFSRFAPRNFLQSYHERDQHNNAARNPPPPSSYYGDDDVERGREISAPLNRNAQYDHLVPHFATVQRPDSSYHPARQYSA